MIHSAAWLEWPGKKYENKNPKTMPDKIPSIEVKLELNLDEKYRRELLLLRYKSRQLEMCGKLLDEAGVPEWVMNSYTETVPANAVPCRLKWYLTRRKNVSSGEIDDELQRDMGMMASIAAEETERIARHSNAEVSRERGG